MPPHQHVEGGHGKREARLTIRPAPMHDLFAMAHERQHGEHRLDEQTVLPRAARTQCERARIALGRQTRLTLPEPVAGAGRRIVQYTYNARGMADRSPGFVTGADYDAAGRMTALRFQNGVENRYDFAPGSACRPGCRSSAPAGRSTATNRSRLTPAATSSRSSPPLPVEAGTF